MGNEVLLKVDKNGTKYFASNICPKCGGKGYLYGYEHVAGGVCFKCGGSGVFSHTWQEYTLEYQAILSERRTRKKREKNLAKRAEFLAKEGFNSDGLTYKVVNGFYTKEDIVSTDNTVTAKFNHSIGWHFPEQSEKFETIILTVEDCFTENPVAELVYKDCDVLESMIEARTPKRESTSIHLGDVGKKLSVEAKLVKSYEFESNFGYYPTTTYIHHFEDLSGNIIVWKTGTPLRKNVTYTITGTVKAHDEYKGVKQTVLTRCKTK